MDPNRQGMTETFNRGDATLLMEIAQKCQRDHQNSIGGKISLALPRCADRKPTISKKKIRRLISNLPTDD